MNIEKVLKSLKKDYANIHLSEGFTKHGWNVLLREFEEQKQQEFTSRHSFIRLTLKIGFAALVFALIGYKVVVASAEALPGNPLYSIKLLKETFDSKVLNNPLSSIEHRGNEAEIILRKDGDTKDFENIVSSYKETVAKTEEVVKKTSNEKKFREVLKKQEQEFHQALQTNPAAKKELDTAIKVAKDAQTPKSHDDKDNKKDENKNTPKEDKKEKK